VLSFWIFACSNAAMADNSADIADIKRLYGQINREIEQGQLKALYLYTMFPSETDWQVRAQFTDDFKHSGRTFVVYYRKGYVAKIESFMAGDANTTVDYYFRENGKLFFRYSEHGELAGAQFEKQYQYEDRQYINTKGRLVRWLHSVYRMKKWKKAGLDSSDNEMEMDEAPTVEEVDYLNVGDFELYKKISDFVK
jgi:hypothetical protein